VVLTTTPIHRCMHRCAQMGFKYAGIQDGQECWCGNTYGSHGSSNECGTECQGDPDLMCGGSLANDVYPAKLLPQLVKEGFKPIDTAISKLRSKITCTGSSRENRFVLPGACERIRLCNSNNNKKKKNIGSATSKTCFTKWLRASSSSRSTTRTTSRA